MRPELRYLLPSNAYRVRPPSDWRMFPRDDSPGCVKSSHRICPCQQYQGCWVWSRAYNVKSSDEQFGSVDVVVSQDLLCVFCVKNQPKYFRIFSKSHESQPWKWIKLLFPWMNKKILQCNKFNYIIWVIFFLKKQYILTSNLNDIKFREM